MAIGPPPNPPIAPFSGQSVLKHGRTTGLTSGSVVDVSFDGIAHYDAGVAHFEGEIVIVGDVAPFSERGDLRSLILDISGCSPHWPTVCCRRFSNDRQSDTVCAQSFRCLGRREMTDIRQAKRSLGRELRSVDGFVGVGRGGIRLNASAETAPVVMVLREKWATATRVSRSPWFSATVLKPSGGRPDAFWGHRTACMADCSGLIQKAGLAGSAS